MREAGQTRPARRLGLTGTGGAGALCHRTQHVGACGSKVDMLRGCGQSGKIAPTFTKHPHGLLARPGCPGTRSPVTQGGVEQTAGGRMGCLATGYHLFPGLLQDRYKEKPIGGASSGPTGAPGPRFAGGTGGGYMALGPGIVSSFLMAFVPSVGHGGLEN